MTIRRRGSVWEYRFDIAKANGKRKQISKSGFRTKKEAESEGIKALTLYENGGLATNYKDISYADLLDMWYNALLPSWSLNTAETYMNVIKLQLKPALGHYKVRSLSPIAMQEYINTIFKELSPSYAKLTKIVLASSLKYAVAPLGIISSNPCEYIKVYHPKSEESPKVVDIKEVNLDDIKEPYKTAIYVGLYTGCRLGEVFALTWNDIDLKGKCINIDKTLSYTAKSWRISAPKTKSSIRKVPIGDSLCRILTSYKAEQLKNKVMYGRYYTKNRVKDGIVNHELGEEYDFVFTEKWGIFAKPSSMERICRNQGFKFHSLRHLHASSLIESGISPKTVQERLGHSNIQTTLQTYTHPTEKMQREAVEVFDKKMRAK